MERTEDGANKSSNKMEIVSILLLAVIELDLHSIYTKIYNYPDQKYKTKKNYICKCNGRNVERDNLYMCLICNKSPVSHILGRKSKIFV